MTSTFVTRHHRNFQRLVPAISPPRQSSPRVAGTRTSPQGGGTADFESLLDDAILLDRVAAGDEGSARILVDRLQPTILKCIRRRLPRWTSEEDLVQTVFAKVFSKLHQFSGSV